MKKTGRTLAFLLFLVSLVANIALGQEATGLPGDNFSLDGALELFKSSKDLAAFEKALNKSNNKVNNLDLNEDGDIDYISVIDNIEGEAHAIVLQVSLNQSDAQDIAVIEIEKNGSESAILQIVGDEDVFGEPMIIEPYEEEGSGGTGGPDADYAIARITVNVWFWSPVRFIYGPRYVRYVSPWRWANYPKWWRPWRPLAWNAWRPYRYYYPSRYRVTATHRVVEAHRAYTPVRTRSVVVRTKTTKVLATNGNRTLVKNYNNNKVIATNKNTGRYAATDGSMKAGGNRGTSKVALTNGEKSMVAKKETGKVAMKNGNRKVVADKSKGKVAATNGRQTKVSSGRKAKTKTASKAKRANQKSKKAVKRKKG